MTRKLHDAAVAVFGKHPDTFDARGRFVAGCLGSKADARHKEDY